MKKLNTMLAVTFLSASLMGSGVALAQDQNHHDQQDRNHHDNHTYVEHKDWRKGFVISHDDWDRGDRVDYHRYHLAAPPDGFEWRMIDGYYVLVNASNFKIRTVVRVH